MKRTPSDTVKNFVRRISDADADFIRSRLRDRLYGDFALCLEFLQKSPDIDRLLASAQSVDEFYSYIDLLGGELDRRAMNDRHAKA